MVCNYIIFSIYTCRHSEVQLNFEKNRRQLQTIRNASLPKAPLRFAAVAEVYANEDILKMYGMTVNPRGSKLFYKNVFSSEQFSYCVFASDVIIDGIKTIPVERRHYLMDATFKVCPFGEFKQLLIIYIGYLERVSNRTFILHTFWDGGDKSH